MLLSLAGVGVLGASFTVLGLLRPRQGRPFVRGEVAEVLWAFLLTIAITMGLILLVAGIAGETLSSLLASSSTPRK
jgi:hypothetical protein